MAECHLRHDICYQEYNKVNSWLIRRNPRPFWIAERYLRISVSKDHGMSLWLKLHNLTDAALFALVYAGSKREIVQWCCISLTW